MKKFTVALIALALVCSSVFAGISVTAGAGFGGQVIPVKDCMKAELGISGMPKELGFTLFAGVDYELDNNITVFGDFYYNSLSSKSLSSVKYAEDMSSADRGICFEKGPVINAIIASDLAVSTGAGYTFHFDQISLMVGAGVDAKMYFAKGGTAEMPKELKELNKDNEATLKGYEADYKKNVEEIVKLTNKTIVLGASLRVKGTYSIDDNWAVSAQINPGAGIIIQENAELAKSETSNGKSFQKIFDAAKIITGNFCVGATYKF